MKFAELTQEVKVARPQNVQFDLGLTPGRRRLRQKFMEEAEKAKDNGGTNFMFDLHWMSAATRLALHLYNIPSVSGHM